MEVLMLTVRFLLELNWRDLLLPLCGVWALASFVCSVPVRPITHPAPADIFPGDYLSPYPEGRHGSRRSIREVEKCQHVSWRNRTFEEFRTSKARPTSSDIRYNLYKFADTTDATGKKYVVGTIAYVRNPYYTFSVLEPSKPGGCNQEFYYTTRSSVVDTVNNRRFGCHLAANAGYFNVLNGQCLGNVVSDGGVVQTSGNEQNANFGIREDGTIVVGYFPDEEITNSTNPFRQLVTGVIWLVRNGTNYVNESMKLECASHEDTGKMETFVNVVSARTALGHDAKGQLVMAQIEGQTHRRGANLYEFADLLIRHGIVNAINTDGGGSNTLVKDGTVLNYPSDHCPGNPQYRCSRAVSTAICIHDVECLEPNCNGHGSCDRGLCSCDPLWFGEACEMLNCSLTNCSAHGSCSHGQCTCDAGWAGELCDKACPEGFYGKDCKDRCWCFGHSRCDPVSGSCTCEPGYKGYGCWQTCDHGYYGSECRDACEYPECSGHGTCSRIDGLCICEEGWQGANCSRQVDSGEGDGSASGSLSTSEEESVSSGDGSLEGSGADGMLDPDGNASWVDQSGNGSEVNRSETEGGGAAGERGGNGDSDNDCGVGSDDTDSFYGRNLYKTTVAIALLVALTTLIVHVALCWVTRKWAYHALQRNHAHRQLHGLTTTRRKRLRKKRPKFRRVPMYSSSSDCSL